MGRQFKMLQMKEKNFIKALNKNRSNLPKIAEMYYEQKIFENKVKDRKYKKTYYTHNVKDIMDMFKIGSSNELLLLLHHHVGEKLGECQYCGLEKSTIKIRSGYNTQDCKHKGICRLCNEPYEYANKEGDCISCTWEKDRAEDQRRSDNYIYTNFDFALYISHQNQIDHIETAKEAQAMMDWASHYYHAFKDRLEQIEGKTTITDVE